MCSDFITPVEAAKTLEDFESCPKAFKKLGQNFLFDPNLCQKIVHQLRITSRDIVIEIGPGPGGLTRYLAKSEAHQVILIEKDERFVEYLSPFVEANCEKMRLYHEDALKTDINTFSKDTYSLKIISNLPYHIATPLLIQWLKSIKTIHSMVLMFQKEVALRITAQVSTSSYGRLSVLSQLICHCKREFDISPRAFVPPPKVTSSIVSFSPLKDAEKHLELIPIVEKITQSAFHQRRKMIKSSLKEIFNEDDFQRLDINPTKRAENLSPQDYLRMAEFLKSLS